MLYRKFGSTNLDTSILGFGCMRLPTVEDADENSDVGNIDKEEAIKMIRYGIDNGINYIDTAYTYHDEKSEVFLQITDPVEGCLLMRELKNEDGAETQDG